MNASDDLSGDRLVQILTALSNPHRLRILAMLAGGRVHVSQLARDVRLSRPLVHMHLQRLEAAGLVTGHLELSDEGRALKFFEVTPFVLHLTPDVVAEAARTLTSEGGSESPRQNKEGEGT
jgi:DNA-binding transcriptional ArsR family regulator